MHTLSLKSFAGIGSTYMYLTAVRTKYSNCGTLVDGASPNIVYHTIVTGHVHVKKLMLCKIQLNQCSNTLVYFC